MSHSTVNSILRQIEALDDEDRLALERRLAERADLEWTQEVDVARRIATERGLDQQTIDREIEDLRYGG